MSPGPLVQGRRVAIVELGVKVLHLYTPESACSHVASPVADDVALSCLILLPLRQGTECGYKSSWTAASWYGSDSIASSSFLDSTTCTLCFATW